MAEPPITLQAVHDDGAGNLTPTRVVIHATNSNIGFPKGSAAGQALGTARYFQEATAGGSAHYVVDVAGEQHCILDSHIAWHAPPNPRSIGIEICAEGGNPSVAPKTYTRAQWLDPQVWPAVQRAAARTRELCQRFGIPVVRLTVPDLLAGRHGICGHVDVSQAWHQTDHSDPGPEFPWPEFLAAVTSNAAPATAAAAPTNRDEEDTMLIPINVKTDGTFTETVPAEAGSSSARFKGGWITFGTAFGGTHFRVCALGKDGGVMGPAAEKELDVANNHKEGLTLPDGATLVTIEGHVIDKDARPTAAWITDPR